MIRRLLRLAFAVGALVWMTGAPAAAHASLISTDPADGAVVASLPEQVVFTFNEPVRLDDGAVRAFAPDGSDWKVTAESTDNRVVVTPAEDPGPGTVVVAWEVISSDGHKVSGALTFSIGAPTAGGDASAAGTTSAPAPVGALRWLAAALAGIGLIGAAALALSGRRADAVWNLGFGAGVLLAPLHQLVDDGRGLGGLTDWLIWVDGVTRPSTLLLLAAYAVLATARASSRRIVVTAVTVPALVLAGGAAYSWPQAERTAPSAAAPAGPTSATAEPGPQARSSSRLSARRAARSR